MWDFQKIRNESEWTPPGWNETGNYFGNYPAAAFAANRRWLETGFEYKGLEILAVVSFRKCFWQKRTTGKAFFPLTVQEGIEGVDWDGTWRQQREALGLAGRGPNCF